MIETLSIYLLATIFTIPLEFLIIQLDALLFSTLKSSKFNLNFSFIEDMNRSYKPKDLETLR